MTPEGPAGLAEAHVSGVLGGARAAGWQGEAWACHGGAQAATGWHLVFLDAGTGVAPDALGRENHHAPNDEERILAGLDHVPEADRLIARHRAALPRTRSQCR